MPPLGRFGLRPGPLIRIFTRHGGADKRGRQEEYYSGGATDRSDPVRLALYRPAFLPGRQPTRDQDRRRQDHAGGAGIKPGSEQSVRDSRSRAGFEG